MTSGAANSQKSMGINKVGMSNQAGIFEIDEIAKEREKNNGGGRRQ